MFDSVNFAFVVALDFDDNTETRYMFSKRVFVHFAEYAAKYTSWESAYHAYKNSDFFEKDVRAYYQIFDRDKKEIVNSEMYYFDELMNNDDEFCFG